MLNYYCGSKETTAVVLYMCALFFLDKKAKLLQKLHYRAMCLYMGVLKIFESP